MEGIKKKTEQPEEFYYYEGLVNESGDIYGQKRHRVFGASRLEALKNLAAYLRQHVDNDGKLGSDFAGDIRGKSPEEAAQIRLTSDTGNSGDGTPWGNSNDIWNQENIGEDIGTQDKK